MNTKEAKPEKILKGGTVISHGVAIGDAIVIDSYDDKIPEYILKSDVEVENEQKRIKKAIDETRKEIQDLINVYNDTDSKLIIDILDSHLKIIEDKTIIERVTKTIADTRKNAEFALDKFFKRYIKLMEESGNDYFKQRVHDFIDIRNRINSKLMWKDSRNIYDSNKKGIIVAECIPPTETAKINRDKILGFVTEIGGATSHSSIIAKGMDIPTVIGVEDLLDEIEEGDLIILDAIHGEVIINPSEQKLNFYKDIREHYEKLTQEYFETVTEDTVTLDKERIYVHSNCESKEEIPLILKSGAEGIGLYRSEFLFIHRKSLPQEDEQFKVFSEVCDTLFPKKVTIRTFDLGGDKFVNGVTRYEQNPYLGWRSVRIALDFKDMFLTHLRALLRASRKGNLRIMFPMISGIEELLKCLDVVEEAKESLRKDGIEFDENLKIGTMIEVPSAVMVADVLAKYVDFFSIGTNDLIQYTIAVDRGNKRISHLYESFHPSIIKLIKHTVQTALESNIEVSVCGEVASDPFYVPMLLGLGIRNISLSPSSIPAIKKVISSIKLQDWTKIYEEKISKVENIQDVKNIIKEKILEDCPEVFDWENLT
jgi:phosphoenolpyruvate-protein phosphotransferase (PTS system enzyme I)